MTKNIGVVTLILVASCLVHGAELIPTSTENKFAAEVAKLAAAPAPAAGGILMVGSSIFHNWQSCSRDLAPLPVINRAFGGSRTADQLFFFGQIVPSSHASLVVWYCGSNDLLAKGTPESILKNTKEWLGRTRAALPQVRILLVSVIRSQDKREAGLLAQVDEVNGGLVQLAGFVPCVSYVDVNPVLETPSGEPLAECYVKDKLHLTPEGYRRLTSVLRPVIEKEVARDKEIILPPRPMPDGVSIPKDSIFGFCGHMLHNDLNGAKLTGVEQASRLLFPLQAGSRDGRPTSQTSLNLVPFHTDLFYGVESYRGMTLSAVAGSETKPCNSMRPSGKLSRLNHGNAKL